MDLPYLTADLPGIGGSLRTTPDDFFVDEEPAYLPAGSGDHVFVHIEKRGMTTPQAVERIARALGVHPRDIGVAGMKDRHAVTRQWLSLPPPVTPDAARALALDDIAIVDVARHPHKLRTGHVRANRFVLRVRGVDADAAARAREILTRLATAPGAPNWYGEQRFGRDGDNAAKGIAIVRGEMKPPRDRKLARLLVSSLQSQLFNEWLAARMRDGLYAQVLAGDILHKLRLPVATASEPAASEAATDAAGDDGDDSTGDDDSNAAVAAERARPEPPRAGGGQFVCEDPVTDQARLIAGELAITGPMFGERMRRPADGSPAAAREAATLEAHGLLPGAFATVRSIAEGTRRDATITVGDPSVRALGDEGIEVAFTLPGGAYATAVMRELMKTS